MKVVTALLTLTITGAAAAAHADEADRLRESAAVIRSMHDLKTAELPSDRWHKAECVVVIPSLKKAGFIIGGEYGRGVVSCRNATGWSAPSFVKLERGSWGAQIGAEQIDLVLLVMNRQGMDKLLEDKFTLGASASASAGPAGRSAAAATDLQMTAGILSYSRSQGLFAGVDVSGGILAPDKEANAEVYGRPMTAREILLEHRATSPASAAAFMSALREEFGGAATN
jgi:lipid-binding SYLF domain-containing protein